MKQQKTRELLVTTKVAEKWKEAFDQKVDELMVLVGKIDSESQMQQACELLDVYHNTQKPVRSVKRKATSNDRPFKFLVCKN